MSSLPVVSLPAVDDSRQACVELHVAPPVCVSETGTFTVALSIDEARDLALSLLVDAEVAAQVRAAFD